MGRAPRIATALLAVLTLLTGCAKSGDGTRLRCLALGQLAGCSPTQAPVPAAPARPSPAPATHASVPRHARGGVAATPGAAPAHLLGLDLAAVVSPTGQVLVTPALARQVAATGARVVRVEFRAAPFGPTGCVPGTTACTSRQAADWTHLFQAYDQVITNLRAVHLQMYGVVDAATVPGDTPDFARTAERIIAHYQGQIGLWQIWDQPNVSGSGYLTPSAFAALLENTYQEVVVQHHLHPTLIAGAISVSANLEQEHQAAGFTYLSGVVAAWQQAGVRTVPVNALAQDISPGKTADVNSLQQAIGGLHAVAQQAGYSLPTYVTGIAWQRGGSTTPEVQASDLTLALAIARSDPFVAAVLVNSYSGAGYGLYGTNGAAEPALAAFEAAARAWSAPVQATPASGAVGPTTPVPGPFPSRGSGDQGFGRDHGFHHEYGDRTESETKALAAVSSG